MMVPISQPDLDSEGVHLPMVVTRNEETVRGGFWPKIAKIFAHVPFATEVVAAYYCAFDRNTPLKVKGVLLAALAYFVLPLDIIPDFILGLGFTDDMTVIVTAIATIRAHMKPEHRAKAEEAIERMKRGEMPAA
jgi:uncharacterized membrane protein YkvA (DUF1232 family)